MKKNELIELGSCNRPHGIKGGFHFFLYNSQESILRNKSLITLFPKDGTSSISKDGIQIKIKSIKFGNKAICYLDGIDDRNIVEDMIPFTIHFERSNFPEAEEGEFYLSDLIGLDVFNPEGDKLGEIQGSYDNGAQDILRVKLPGEIIDVPFIDNFFPEIDMENQKIIMIMPEIME